MAHLPQGILMDDGIKNIFSILLKIQIDRCNSIFKGISLVSQAMGSDVEVTMKKIIKSQKSCLIQFFIFQLILEFILVRVVFKTGFLQWLTINKPNISSIKIILLSLKSKYNKNEINFREIFIAYLQ